MNTMVLTVPPGGHTVTFTREIDAPPDVVFEAMMDAALIPQWWGPSYLTTTVLTHEPVTGGSWTCVQTDPEGHSYGFRGVFHEIVPAVRTVQTFEFDGAGGHVSLDSLRFVVAGAEVAVDERLRHPGRRNLGGAAPGRARRAADVGAA